MSRPIEPLNVAFTAESIKRQSMTGAAATFVAQIMKFVVQLASRVALARLLNPQDFGLIAMVAPVFSFVQVLNDLGFDQAVIQRKQVTHQQISALFWINALIGLSLSLLTAALAPLIAYLYGEPRTLEVTIVMGSLIFLSSLSVLPAALLNRQLRFIPLAIVDGGCVLIGLAAAVIAAWSGMGYWSLVVMQAGSSVSGLILMWYFAAWRPSWPRREAGIGSLVRFGANLMGSNLATYVSMSADNILVGVFAGPVALGLYDTSYNLVVKPLGQIIMPVSRIAVPMLSRLVELPERYRSTYNAMIQAMMLAYLPGMLFATFSAKPLILLLLGTKWAGTVPIFAWICVGGLVAPLFTSAGWLLTSQNRTRELMRASTATAVLSIVSFVLGIMWGALGVAILSSLCFSLVQVPLMLQVATSKGPVPLRAVLHTLLPFGGATLVTASALWFLTPMLPDSIFGLMFVAIISYIMFVTSLACLPGGGQVVRQVLNLRNLGLSMYASRNDSAVHKLTPQAP